MRIKESTAASLTCERSVQSDHLIGGLVTDGHVELPDVATHEPVQAAGVLLGPVHDVTRHSCDGEPILLFTS